MEFLTGVKEKETVGIRQILAGAYTGKTVKVHGAVHNIRDMGEVAFVILRKAEGLVCVRGREMPLPLKRSERGICRGGHRPGDQGRAGTPWL